MTSGNSTSVSSNGVDKGASLLRMVEASGERLSARQEADAVHEVHSLTIEEGDVWSLVDFRWFQSWCNYSGFDPLKNVVGEPKSTARPGKIDNSALAGMVVHAHCLRIPRS
jgi:hypothetical protein